MLDKVRHTVATLLITAEAVVMFINQLKDYFAAYHVKGQSETGCSRTNTRVCEVLLLVSVKQQIFILVWE